MNETQKKMVETYQCPGCANGHDISCFEPSDDLSCSRHVAGTMGFPAMGKFYLGLPKGFCRVKEYETHGQRRANKINIFDTFPPGNWSYDKFNVPVWKHLDENFNTLVRGISPRVDLTWIHIFVGDVTEKIQCLEISQYDIDWMD